MNDRELLILRNILTALKEAGDLPVLLKHLQDEVSMATPQLKPAEFDDLVNTAEQRRLVTTLAAERGMLYAITDAGKIWLQNNRI